MTRSPVREPAGSLTIVGAGIRPGLHTTQEAVTRIRRAEKVLYLLAEVVPTTWIERLNPSAESLAPLYQPGRDRAEVYERIVSAILAWVRRGQDTCVVSYGHPAVLDQPSHEAVRRARAEGFPASILPGISAMDCLFADLGVDPGENGCQSFEGTDFLVSARAPDVRVPLILWQVSAIGETQTTGTVNRRGLKSLAQQLEKLYGEDHEVVVYEASPFPVGRPTIERCRLKGLAEAGVTGMSTLYVPPKPELPLDPPVPDPARVAQASS